MAGRRHCGQTWIIGLLITCALRTIQSAELYPYGTSEGDSTMANNNDIYQTLVLQQDFPFGENFYNELLINDNGILTFNEPANLEYSGNSPNPSIFRNLPFYYDLDGDGNNDEQPDAILPFWSDVDITSQGNIFYRETTDSAVLTRATTEVQTFFRSNMNFEAADVIIVTWEDVSFFEYQNGANPTDTFQAVLVTDGQESFVFFLYDTIEWTIGTKMGGDEQTGLYPGGAGAALIGFNMQLGTRYFILEPYSRDDEQLVNLPTSTNVDVDGQFAFKVDGDNVIDPTCGNDKDLTITPTRGGMLGGERIYLYGPCWDSIVTTSCVFTFEGQEVQRVNATVVSNEEAYCVPMPFFLVGEVEVVVIEHGADLTGGKSASYSLIESARVTPTITRQDSTSSSWRTAGNSLRITWTPDTTSFGANDMLTASVLAYREDGSAGPRWETVYVISNNTGFQDGQLNFEPTAQSGVTSENAFGVIKMTATSADVRRVLWSDIHTLGYLLEQDYQDAPEQWAVEKCSDWITEDDSKGTTFQNGLPACPCDVEQAREDIGAFVVDIDCFENGETSDCEGHGEAQYCIVSSYASNEGAGTNCCYDENGLLMYAGNTKDAGMSARSHIRGASPYMQADLVPELSHWTNDLIAKEFCCEWATETQCYEYRTRRPTTDCSGYEPPNIALSFGDPHYITMDRFNYTFNGLGEFTLLRYASSSTGAFSFELQGRQVRSQNVNGNPIDVTQLSAVAMQAEDSDVIFMEASPNNGMSIYRRPPGETSTFSKVSFSQQTLYDLQGCSVGATEFERNVEIIGAIAMFKTTGIGIYVSYREGMLAVRPILPSTLNSNNLHGLLGNMDGNADNDLTRRDGTVLGDNPTDQEIHDFGLTWEIEEDYQLFYYTRNNEHSSYHNNSFVPALGIDLYSYDQCYDVEQCLFDYTVSLDPSLADATYQTYTAFQTSYDTIQKRDACPNMPTPLNGTRTPSDPTNLYFEDAELVFGCLGNLILTGSVVRRCEMREDGTLGWTGTEEGNECRESVCGHLDSPNNGSITLDETGQVARFGCDDGFSLSGSGQSECLNGQWSSETPSCITGGGVNVVGLAVGLTVGFMVVIAAVIVIILFMKNKNKSTSSKSSKSKSRPKTTDARDLELAEPLNKKPGTDASGKSSTYKSNEDPSAQIYKPTPLAQASGKKTSTTKKPSTKPPEPVKKDPAPAAATPKSEPTPKEPAVNPTVTTVDEKVPLAQQATVEKSAPPPSAAKPRTPETLPRSIASSDDASRSTSYSSAPPSKTPPRDDVDIVKGTGYLTNTNISGSGGWI
ncbi:sushi domain-containing protein 2-like [Diadema setosum]|uniref:sushi domain-containing protein 2-like n=1 Tax=Diadema setosum TaxID=31175 RepID=UPI003B3B9383